MKTQKALVTVFSLISSAAFALSCQGGPNLVDPANSVQENFDIRNEDSGAAEIAFTGHGSEKVFIASVKAENGLKTYAWEIDVATARVNYLITLNSQNKGYIQGNTTDAGTTTAFYKAEVSCH